jgi:transposase
VQELLDRLAQQTALAQQHATVIERQAGEPKHKTALLDKLTYEMAVLKRLNFAAKTEALNAGQASLLQESLEEDLQAVSEEIEQLRTPAERAEGAEGIAKSQPKRLPLPEHLPRQEFVHESTECCGQPMTRMGEEASEKLDYQPGVFTVHRHVRSKWVCACCSTLKQQPVDALRLAALGHRVIHADETPVQMLKPERNGKTHRAYLWAYTPSQHEELKAVVYNFCESRAGSHAKAFLENWQGTLVVDDYSDYKQLMGERITEAGCWAHARRKFFELHAASKSQIAQQALLLIGELNELERQGQNVDADERLRIRQQQSQPIIDKLYNWLTEHRPKVPEGSATAKAMDYSLRRWPALTLFLGDALVPIDNNWVENQIRPVALGRKNWLFAGSLRAGQRVAVFVDHVHGAQATQRIDLHPRATPGGGELIEAERAPQLPQRPHIAGATAALEAQAFERVAGRRTLQAARSLQCGDQLVDIAARLEPAESANGALAWLAVLVAKGLPAACTLKNVRPMSNLGAKDGWDGG